MQNIIRFGAVGGINTLNYFGELALLVLGKELKCQISTQMTKSEPDS
jgi:putative flippase GtrA